MPECVTCGEDQFDEIDGLFFCVTCQTQTQDLRLEEEEDTYAALGPSVRLKIAHPKQSKGQKKVKDKGRPWITDEAFQIIIKKQVEALIKLGADPQLEEIVFRLWVLYLSKTGTAFSENSSNKLPELVKFGYERDVYPGSLANPTVKSVRFRRTHKKNFGVSMKKADKDIAKKNLTLTLEKEEFYEGDNPIDHEDGSSKTSSDDEEEEEEEEGPIESEKSDSLEDSEESEDVAIVEKSNKFNERNVGDHIQRMTILKTLCFCYLGLMFTNNDTMPADIVRWVKRDKIPYLCATRLLPDDMKLSTHDFWIFTPSIPSIAKIQSTVGRLAYFLELKDFPAVSMSVLVSKYILMLDLPAEIHGFVLNLMRNKEISGKFIPKETKKILPHYEAIAMAYIIIALKLLLGLDDHTERQLSECAKELMQMINKKYVLFVWDDWVKHISRKVTREYGQHIAVSRYSDAHNVRDVDTFMEHYRRVAGHNGKYGPNRVIAKEFQETTREALGRPLQLLEDKWKDSCFQSSSLAADPTYHPSSTGEPSTSFQTEPEYDPSGTATLFDEDPAGFLLGGSDNGDNSKTGDCDLVGRERDSSRFRHSTVKYITQPGSFLDDLDNKGLTTFTVHSSCLSSSDEDESTHEDMCDEDGYTSPDLFSDPVLRKRRRKSKPSQKSGHSAKERVRQALLKSSSERTVTQISSKGRFVDVLQKLVRAHENFILYTGEQSTNSSKNWSYNALLSVCSCMIECNIEALDAEVVKLQMVYFPEAHELDRSGRHRLLLLLRKYF